MNSPKDRLRVDFDYLPLINFAIQQHRVTIIHRLSVTNCSDRPLENLRVDITADPNFGSVTPIAVDRLSPQETVHLKTFGFTLSAAYFAGLTERLSGCLKLEISEGEELVFNRDYPIDLLTYDQWAGLDVHPELLAAYITPNHDALVPILQRASAILEQWTGKPSLDEYQSRNPDRARKQMAAVYAAIAEQSVIYSTVPAGFESSGQRIRTVDVVIAQKLGTCLDMALLYASCLEAVGLHAFVVVTQGHAFAGAWLVPETFPDAIVDDVSLLTKRTAEGIYDIALVETTCMNAGKSTDFDEAVKIANGQLTGANHFIWALDVKRARFSGIRPIPQRVQNGNSWEIKAEADTDAPTAYSTPKSINPYDLSGGDSAVTLTKQLMWERRLLDLSLRNNLLNIRITKNTLQLIPANFAALEDALYNGDEFSILHCPADWKAPEPYYGIYSVIPESDPITEMIASELTQKRLRSYLSENDLSKALTHLYRTSRSSLEENGANTLYLAIGLLKWYETPASERARYAPLLLMPVEIVRKSVAKGYIIRSREEEIMMNITLLEMLRQNFGITISGLDVLPTDEHGVDVKRVYSILRNGIKNQRRWDVEEQSVLGIFSFNKFIMWNDIHNNSDKLAKNKIVESLIKGQIGWEIAGMDSDASVINTQLSSPDVLLPISADSSQLEAVHEAINDKTFILHGPPGTGKSQTITNIIANALYKGKRVLFVAEKMAALSVVEKRLDALGIGAFCLELHSNKAKKSAVLSQLKNTTEIIRRSSPESFAREADRLSKLRQELNVYVEALHKEYPFGLSLYDAIALYQSSHAELGFNIPLSLLDMAGKETVVQWEDALETAISAANACGHPHTHPLSGIAITSYSGALKDEAVRLLKEFEGLLQTLRAKLPAFQALWKETYSRWTHKDFQAMSHLARILDSIPELTPELLIDPLYPGLFEELECTVACGLRRDELKSILEERFTQEVFTVNAEALMVEWNRAADQWFLPRYMGQNKVKKALRRYAFRPLATDDVEPVLTQLVRYRREAEAVQKQTDRLLTCFGRFGKVEDWKNIESIIRLMKEAHSSLLVYAKERTKVTLLKKNLAEELTDGIQSYRQLHGVTLSEWCTLAEALQDMEQRLADLLGVTTDALYSADSTDWLNIGLGKAQTWVEHIDRLKDWFQWLEASRKLHELGIGFVADEYTRRNIPTPQLLGRFRKSLYRSVIQYITSKEPVLELFSGQMFNDTIARYRQMVADFEQLTRQEIFAKLASQIPLFTQEAILNSEVGILQKNIRSNGRGMSIRKLFDQIPTLLPRMCPCMLMSPLSVAQFIDADAEKFDLIVFDEASQMPTYEAVGAIARGKNVVIVGDPKQMPPTNFFSVNASDEENMEIEDLESVLDDCLALSIPSKYLLWHYRSKHESLIAFSNSEYYESKLLTFPSPDSIESKVRVVPVEGVYDKGKTRQNKAEAQAVVDEIARRLRDGELRKRSIGVVTFSIVQQSLIEDLLADFFIAHPDLETLAMEGEEPLFIKNLENVQGDERDVILFSVGYGPDSSGRVSMNFGPLNRTGGERRLNVAVSRSRYEMIIFSTLRSEMIDLNRTSSVGVAGLKRFLEYAERGTKPSLNMTDVSTSSKHASIETVVADRLREMGYTVHTNIGYSGYKINIGIVDPKEPSRYLLGIVCDGKDYRSTKTVRDREIVQNSVLKMLGWRIFRLWTMEWWENPDDVLAAIRKAVEQGETSESAPVVQKIKTESEESRRTPDAAPVSPPPAVRAENPTDGYRQEYREAKLTEGKYKADNFFHARSQAILNGQVKRITEDEAPITKTMLCKKILSEWGITRLAQRMEFQLAIAFDEAQLYRTWHGEQVVFWKDEEQYRTYTTYRPVSNRGIGDLPPEELANGIRHIVAVSLSLPLHDLLKGCAKTFGFNRMNANVEAAMRRGVDEAVSRGYIRLEGDRVMPASTPAGA